ncbi:MAG: hypothetical protein ACTSU7_02875 [Candidatus Heimdallarchaeaceae archaeon]
MQVEKFIQCVKLARKARVPTMAWGPPGVGKSMGFAQAAMEISNDEFNTSFKDLREYKNFSRKWIEKHEYPDDAFLFHTFSATLADPTDLMGIPVTHETRNNGIITTWARPDFIHTRGNGILVIDELSNAELLTKNACYSLMLDGCVKNHYLGPGWYPSSAGNRPEDKSGARDLPAALITRMIHLGVGCDLPNFADKTIENADIDPTKWVQWAINNNIRPEVFSFIQARNSMIYRNQATPRTWEDVSRIIDVSGGWNEIVEELILGTVGAGPGQEFSTWLRLKDKLPDIDLIIQKPELAPVPDPEEIDVVYFLCSELIYRANKENASNIVTYATKENGIAKEMETFLIHGMAMKNDGELLDVEAILDWHTNNPEIILP